MLRRRRPTVGGPTRDSDTPLAVPKFPENGSTLSLVNNPSGEVAKDPSEIDDRFRTEREIGESSRLSIQTKSETELDSGLLGGSQHDVDSDDSVINIVVPQRQRANSENSPDNFKKGKSLKSKRPIDPLAGPSDLPSGEVISDANTPTNNCPTFEVFAPDSRAYLVKSP